MHVDWCLISSGGDYQLFVSRNSTAGLLGDGSPDVRLSTLARPTDDERLPRWLTMATPLHCRVSAPPAEMPGLISQLFAKIGPVGVILGSAPSQVLSWTVAHPLLGTMTLLEGQQQHGIKFTTLPPEVPDFLDTLARAAQAMNWELKPKEGAPYRFVHQVSSGMAKGLPKELRVALLPIATALANGQTVSLSGSLSETFDERLGWRAQLELSLDDLRRAHDGRTQVAEARLATVDALLERGALRLATERLDEYLSEGGAPSRAIGYQLRLAWLGGDWQRILDLSTQVQDTQDPMLLWPIVWAETELGILQRAARRLAALRNPPQLSTREGVWLQATEITLAAAQHDLGRALKLFSQLPADPIAGGPRSQALAKLRQILRRDFAIAANDDEAAGAPQTAEQRQALIGALGTATAQQAEDLPEELRPLLAACLRPPALAPAPVPVPAMPAREAPSFAEWAAAQERGGRRDADGDILQRQAEEILRGELALRSPNPSHIAQLVAALIPAQSNWRPSPRRLALLRRIDPAASDWSEFDAREQAALARAMLVAGESEPAAQWARLALPQIEQLDPLAAQAIAEALTPDFADENQLFAARAAWLRLLQSSLRWTTLPRLVDGPDIRRGRLTRDLALALFVNDRSSELFALLFRELDQLDTWAALWDSRELLLHLIDALVGAGDKSRALKVALDLLETALAAQDPRFISQELLGRFESPTQLGPLEPHVWLDILESMTAALLARDQPELREWVQNMALQLRSRYGHGGDSSIAADLTNLLRQLGVDMPQVAEAESVALPTTVPANLRNVLLVGGDPHVQARTRSQLEELGLKVKLLSPGFSEQVSEKTVREALTDCQRVIMVWRCILHKVSYLVTNLLDKPDYKHIKLVYSKGKGHSSLVRAALGEGE